MQTYYISKVIHTINIYILLIIYLMMKGFEQVFFFELMMIEREHLYVERKEKEI